MSITHVLGIVVIVGAYGLTWYLLLKSTHIVNLIHREKLPSTRAIKIRLKHRDHPGKEEI